SCVCRLRLRRADVFSMVASRPSMSSLRSHFFFRENRLSVISNRSFFRLYSCATAGFFDTGAPRLPGNNPADDDKAHAGNDRRNRKRTQSENDHLALRLPVHILASRQLSPRQNGNWRGWFQGAISVKVCATSGLTRNAVPPMGLPSKASPTRPRGPM